MRAALLAPLAVLASVLLAAGAAGAAPPGPPTGLHGFLLRADEPRADTFSRTPAFAWNPVPGATGYEFQLSTSNTFSNASGDNVSDNSIFYDTNSLTSPVASPPLVLPWITGTPHALYARVRATTPDGVTAWSADYGFDLEPDPLKPSALPTNGDEGLLRWTPIAGADSYEVWLLDLPHGGKVVHTRTNVLDEREFYTFHDSQQWIGTIHWRVRAVRSTEAGGPHNGLPVSSYSAWSPPYVSTNANPTTGQLALRNTISDVVQDGSNPHNQPAHKLMPAFSWSGDQLTTPTGTTISAELFRVEIFSDAECLNRVYAGPIVGGRSWAPRPWGSMALPDPTQIPGARTVYPSDGAQGVSSMYDGTGISSNEDQAPASPTSAAPPDAIPSGSTQPSTSAPPPATFGPATPSPLNPGAPVDLWDTYWPDTGYYWTVMPVQASTSTPGAVAAPGASKGSTLVPVTDSSQYSVGETIAIGTPPNSDTVTIAGVGSGILTVAPALGFGHGAGETITLLGSSGSSYKDMVLPQDLCAAKPGGFGLVQKLGLWSEPSLGAPQAPFVTGLSANGGLISATGSSQLYGQPLVAWTPALGAQKYELEWSSSNTPFIAAGNLLTTSTSAVLPLSSGTWYFRVRGFDYNLPTGAQQMAWSTPQSVTLAAPAFRIVGSVGPSTPKKKSSGGAAAAATRYDLGDFSLALPKPWRRTTAARDILFMASTPDKAKLSVTQPTVARGGKSYLQWAQQVAAAFRTAGVKGTIRTGAVREPAGTAAYVAFAAGTAGTPTTVVVYLFDAGSVSYELAFGAPGSLASKYKVDFARIAASFRHG